MKKQLNKLYKALFGSVGSKVRSYYWLFAILPIVAIGVFANLTLKSTSDRYLIANGVKRIQLEAKLVEDVVSDYSKDLKKLAETPPIQGIIRARENNGFDKEEDSTYEQWTQRLSQIFSGTIAADGNITQLRYLDESGKELVRVDNLFGDYKVVSEANLQDKSDRTYFKEALLLEKGQLYISNLELNREGTPPIISTPILPVIRYATPITNPDGEKKGIVILNIDARVITDTLEVAELVETDLVPFKEFVLDSEGFYVSHNNPAKTWGGPRDFNTGENLSKDYTEQETKAVLEAEEIGHQQSEAGAYLFFAPVEIPSDNGGLRLNIVNTIESIQVRTVLSSIQAYTVIGVLVGTALVIVIGLLIGNQITARFKVLIAQVRAIEKGDLSYRLNIQSKDEIQELAEMTIRIADKMESSKL